MTKEEMGAAEGEGASIRRLESERLIYVIPQESLQSLIDTEVSLLGLWKMLWANRWFIVLITAAFAAASVAYLLLAQPWYQAEVLLAPSDDDSMPTLLGGQMSGFAGLAGLAGFDVGGGNKAEAIAVLESRDFTEEFIKDKDLLPVLLYERWDSDSETWESDDPTEWPDVRDAIKFFSENVRSVSESTETGLVTLRVAWTDPAVAAGWADELVNRLNDRMRTRAIAEATVNIEYLKSALNSTTVGTLQESIGSILEVELQKLMLAKGKSEFAFRVIDSADVPKQPASPKAALTIVLGIFLGGAVSMIVLLIRHLVSTAGADS